MRQWFPSRWIESKEIFYKPATAFGLIYNDPESTSLRSIGIECTAGPGESIPFPPKTTAGVGIGTSQPLESTASLADVASAKIFEDGDTGICRGILLIYENGGMRALGQCRVGVDKEREFQTPRHMCYRRYRFYSHKRKHDLRGVQVAFSSDCSKEHGHSDEFMSSPSVDTTPASTRGYNNIAAQPNTFVECFPMTGSITLYFDLNGTIALARVIE